MLTPVSQRNAPDRSWHWAADNGCFSAKWEHDQWQRWLLTQPQPETALFATVPDVVADHKATLERWKQFMPIVKQSKYKAAFVIQDGATIESIPWSELDAIFIGGSTKFKLSDYARNIAKETKQQNKWLHMGRVNSLRRMIIAQDWQCDSIDGTFLAFGPDVNTPRLIAMMQKLESMKQQSTLFE